MEYNRAIFGKLLAAFVIIYDAFKSRQQKTFWVFAKSNHTKSFSVLSMNPLIEKNGVVTSCKKNTSPKFQNYEKVIKLQRGVHQFFISKLSILPQKHADA